MLADSNFSITFILKFNITKNNKLLSAYSFYFYLKKFQSLIKLNSFIENPQL